MSLRKALLTSAAGACQLTLLVSPSLIDRAGAQTLEKFAALPADTFAPGPTSGQFIIERDSGQGPTALFKKVFLVNLDDVDANGFLVKHEVVDLLSIADPHDVGGTGTGVFTFPFVTIESVIPLGRRRIGVLNDNNYPGSAGRTAGQPDNNEFIVIRLAQPLPAAALMRGIEDGDTPGADLRPGRYVLNLIPPD